MYCSQLHRAVPHVLLWLFFTDWQKTESQKQREKLLLDELVKIVDKRDEIVQELDSQERA